MVCLVFVFLFFFSQPHHFPLMFKSAAGSTHTCLSSSFSSTASNYTEHVVSPVAAEILQCEMFAGADGLMISGVWKPWWWRAPQNVLWLCLKTLQSTEANLLISGTSPHLNHIISKSSWWSNPVFCLFVCLFGKFYSNHFSSCCYESGQHLIECVNFGEFGGVKFLFI